MAMYEVGTVTGAASQARVTGATTKWSQVALGIQPESILVVYRSGSADLYAIKSVDSDTQLTLTRNITTAFSGASYGIITAETASTSSFANQLASAFAFWRSVVEGWSMALTGSGNITLTDPITGKQVTVPAIAGMAKASDLNALAKLTGGNDLAGSQVITSDNAGFILGRNNDIGLVKKSGTYGKLMVGSGTRFSVVKGNKATISPEDTQTEIMGVDSAGNLAVPGNISAGKYFAQAIELSMSTPYIDFHFNDSTADYTTRLIENVAGELTLEGAFMCKKHLYAWGALMARSVAPSNPANGQLITGAPFQSMIQGRGGFGDARGAVANYYVEESVGSEHRAVVYLDGYGRTDAWIFRAGGTISTGKGDVLTTGSDVRLKEDFTEAPQNALQRVERLGVCEYQMKGENRRRRGFIAQQADTVDTTYTFMGCEHEIDGEKFQVMNVDYVAIIADLVSSVQELTKQVRDLNKLVQT
ncbi:tail fiber domain-containing protein [Klebsiella variicola]|uniref:tail fiber domain-containing protein n=2 Tax=Klebsiella pneumoniae complex TaxID=3390273 RepID=UPI001FB668B1|nr:tail fiber domain-containing protein [Klebsiella variicola]MCJ1958171.1 tail fiber domain-containing protein [Klebsiella variicola]